jgi:predicted small metal-binding protein
MREKIMGKISCKNYGFDCKFEVDSSESNAINRFQKHSMVVHGIEYSSGTLSQIVMRIKN